MRRASRTYTKDELIFDVSQWTKQTQVKTRGVVRAVLNSLADAITSGDRVELRGFGTFRARRVAVPERDWVNPLNKRVYKIKRKTTVVFRASASFTRALAQRELE